MEGQPPIQASASSGHAPPPHFGGQPPPGMSQPILGHQPSPPGQLEAAGPAPGNSAQGDGQRGGPGREARGGRRPGRGMFSSAIIAMAAVAWVLIVQSLMSHTWRANSVGVLGHPKPRSWGLWAVRGERLQMHHQIAKDTCKWQEGLHFGVECRSHLCSWYQAKCEAYQEIKFYSYATGTALLLAGALHAACIAWTLSLEPAKFAYAAAGWCVVFLVYFAALMTYEAKTQACFVRLNSFSFYPEPPTGLGFKLAAIATFIMMPVCLAGWVLTMSSRAPKPLKGEQQGVGPEDGGRAGPTAGSEDEGDDEFLKGKSQTKAVTTPQGYVRGRSLQGPRPPQAAGMQLQ